MKPQPKFQSYQEIGYNTIHRLTPVLIFFIMPSNANNICLFFTLPLGDWKLYKIRMESLSYCDNNINSQIIALSSINTIKIRYPRFLTTAGRHQEQIKEVI